MSQDMSLSVDTSKHREAIQERLAGKKVEPGLLWCAVGYFWHGAGRFASRSFATQTQWRQLLRETGRDAEAEEL